MTKVFLKEVCTLKKGRKPDTLSKEFLEGWKPYVLIENFNGALTSFTNDVKCIECNKDDVLVVSDGARCGLSSFGHEGYIGSTIIGLAPNQEKILPKFLYYFISGNFELLNTRTKGAAIPHLDKSYMMDLSFELPPLPEQERIVRLLDEADALRTQRTQANERMEDFVPALFEEMFGDFSKHEQVQISGIAKIQGGLQLTPKRNDYPLRKPYLRVANVQRGYLILDEIKEINLTEDEFTKTKLEQGDILVVEGNGNPAEIGRAAIWHNQVENCVHQNHLIRIRCDSDRLLPDYLVIFLNSETGRKYFLKSGNTTSGLVTISTSVVKKCNLPLPPLALQREFAERVKEAREIQSTQGRSTERVEALYQSMLDRAFKGEL